MSAPRCIGHNVKNWVTANPGHDVIVKTVDGDVIDPEQTDWIKDQSPERDAPYTKGTNKLTLIVVTPADNEAVYPDIEDQTYDPAKAFLLLRTTIAENVKPDALPAPVKESTYEDPGGGAPKKGEAGKIINRGGIVTLSGGLARPVRESRPPKEGEARARP